MTAAFAHKDDSILVIGTAGQGIVNTPYQVTDRALAAKQFGFSGSLERGIKSAPPAPTTFRPSVAAPSRWLSGVGLDTTAALSAPGVVPPTESTTGGTLAAGTYYYYVVTALDAAGETTGSAEASATTTGTTSSISLAWAAVVGATSYKVYRGTAAGAESVYFTTATNSYEETGATGIAGTVPTVNTTSGATAGFNITFSDVTSDAGTRYQIWYSAGVLSVWKDGTLVYPTWPMLRWILLPPTNMTRCLCSAIHETPPARGKARPDPAGPDAPRQVGMSRFSFIFRQIGIFPPRAKQR